MKRCILLLSFACALQSAACGPQPAPVSPSDDAREKHEARESIGQAAAAQGGFSSLGGAGNREEAPPEPLRVDSLHADEVVASAPVKLDGVLREWPARTNAIFNVAGATTGLSFDVGAQVDDTRIYVAAEVKDPKLVRTQRHGETDDHVSMLLAFPNGGSGQKVYEVGFFPAKPGEGTGAVKWLSGAQKGHEIVGAKIVENDIPGGFAFEAALLWSTFAESQTTRVGLRAAFRYHDADSHSVLGTNGGSYTQPAGLEAFLMPSEIALATGFLAPRNFVGTAPSIDFIANVAGDERKEHVRVFGNFLTICGPGYRDGHQFFWREMDGTLVSLETRELTARGREDLIVRRRMTHANITHELLEVWSIGTPSFEPTPVFVHEVSVFDASSNKRIDNTVRITPTQIDVTAEPSTAWNEATFHEPAGGAESILLPWGTVRSQTYRLSKGVFMKSAEAINNSNVPASRSEAAEVRPTTESAPSRTGASFDDYLKAQGLDRETRPRFSLSSNVDGDARPEQLGLFGLDLVILGPGFRQGNGYATLSLSQFSKDMDIEEVSTRDLTGDDANEIVVRGVRHVTSPHGERVDVRSLFVYRITDGTIRRVFSLETGRSFDRKKVEGSYRFVAAKRGKGFDIEIRRGTAAGWNAQSYPWPEDKPGASIEPMLLPWSSVASRRYTWNGTQFTAN